MSEPIITCPRHPKTVTYLKCASCNTPICPDCSVQTPVGFKCKRCGTFKETALFSVSPLQAAATILVGVIAGGLAGFILPQLGFFSIWIAMPYGRFAGMVIQRVSGHKLGLLMEVLTGVSIIIGGIGLRVFWVFYQFTQAAKLAQAHVIATIPRYDAVTMLLLYTGGLYTLLVTLIVAASAVSLLSLFVEILKEAYFHLKHKDTKAQRHQRE